MNTRRFLSGLLLVAGLSAFLVAADKPRNPFGVNDVASPFSPATIEFAKNIELPGGKDDVNAEDWAKDAVQGNPMFLDGQWYGRWNNGDSGSWSGPSICKIKVVEDRVYILYGSSYLIEARRQGDNKLVGGYTTVGSNGSTHPWVGIIVDGERIDGVWNTAGARWDFRRRAVRELPQQIKPK